MLDLALGRGLALALGLRAHPALRVFVDLGARDRRVARVRRELIGDALRGLRAVGDVQRDLEIAEREQQSRLRPAYRRTFGDRGERDKPMGVVPGQGGGGGRGPARLRVCMATGTPAAW